MKLPAFLSLLAAGCCAIGASAEGQGVWLEQKHDFGAFDEGLGTVYCDFRLVNTGNEPIAIINAPRQLRMHPSRIFPRPYRPRRHCRHTCRL